MTKRFMLSFNLQHIMQTVQVIHNAGLL